MSAARRGPPLRSAIASAPPWPAARQASRCRPATTGPAARLLPIRYAPTPPFPGPRPAARPAAPEESAAGQQRFCGKFGLSTKIFG